MVLRRIGFVQLRCWARRRGVEHRCRCDRESLRTPQLIVKWKSAPAPALGCKHIERATCRLAP